MKIYSIGYSGWKPDRITQLPAELDAVLLDVRFVPRSRYQPWDGRTFAARLGEGYRWAGKQFGNRAYKDPAGRIELADYEAGKAVVEAIIASGKSVILMCGCKDLATCHRKVVAERLAADLGLEAEHLRAVALEPTKSREAPARPSVGSVSDPTLFPSPACRPPVVATPAKTLENLP
jgi:uncharacterized protein (DUF488 family)